MSETPPYRLLSLVAVLCILFSPDSFTANLSALEVRDIGTDRQLFVVEDLIDGDLSQGATRTLNPPYRIQRVLKPEQASEALGFIFYCSVVDDKGVAKLFHGSYDGDKKKHFALAVSRDGIHWERPGLGLTEYQGNKENNLLPLEAVEASVFLDPRAPADKRYRLLYSRRWPDHHRRHGPCC